MKAVADCPRLEHSPTLNTVLMVECALKNADKGIVTIAGLKRMLPRQVNHNMLMVILDYLEQSNKIAVSLKGISWVYNSSRKMQAELRKGYAYPAGFSG